MKFKFHSLVTASLIALLSFSLAGCGIIDWGYEAGKRTYEKITMPTLQWAVSSIMDNDPDVRRKALNIIATRAEKTGDAKLVDIIGTVLNGDAKSGERPDHSLLVRAAAANALGEIREKKIAVPHLLCAVKRHDERPLVLMEVIRALGKLGNGKPRVQEALIAALTDKDLDLDVRREAAIAIGKVGDEEAIPVLIDVLVKEKNSALRVALGACDSLQKLTGKPFGPEVPENWVLWYSENGSEEIVLSYIEGRWELAKLWPKRSPISQRIPDNVKRVLEGMGAEIVLAGKSALDTARSAVGIPRGAARLVLKKPVKGVKRVLPGTPKPRKKKEGPGFFTKVGAGVAAPFVVVGRAVAWPFKKVAGIFKKKPAAEKIEEPAEEPRAEPVEPVEPAEPTEKKPGLMSRIGRGVAAPFVFAGKVVAWPFKKVAGIFKKKPAAEKIEEPAEEPKVEPVEPTEPVEPAEPTEKKPGLMSRIGRGVAAPFVVAGKVVAWPFQKVAGIFKKKPAAEKIEEPAEEPKVEPVEPVEPSEPTEKKPGLMSRIGRGVAAPFVVAGKVVAWPFQKVAGIFKKKPAAEKIEEPAEEPKVEPVEPVEPSEPTEKKPGLMSRIGRGVAAPFVVAGRVVAWPFQKVAGIFKRKPKTNSAMDEVEPAPVP